MPLGITICRFSTDFWNQKPSHVGKKMHSKIDSILTNLESTKWLQNLYNSNEKSYLGGRKIDWKSIENRTKNETKMGMALNTHFSWIFVDLGSVMGRLRSALEPSWENLGGALGRPGSILNLNCLRRVQKPSWRRLWPSLRAKSRAKGHRKATGKPVSSNEREACWN